MTISAGGWAVVDGGKLMPITFATTRIASIVGWLAATGRFRRALPFNASDAAIEAVWNKVRGEAEVVQVTVTTVTH